MSAGYFDSKKAIASRTVLSLWAAGKFWSDESVEKAAIDCKLAVSMKSSSLIYHEGEVRDFEGLWKSIIKTVGSPCKLYNMWTCNIEDADALDEKLMLKAKKTLY